mmetsp:Transcript_2976/g.6620  ORF Transcript_2976/g.6620 Transcript_2976/m.6620 type:complete len:106 (+) Transcript_2976:422-739(+)
MAAWLSPCCRRGGGETGTARSPNVGDVGVGPIPADPVMDGTDDTPGGADGLGDASTGGSSVPSGTEADIGTGVGTCIIGSWLGETDGSLVVRWRYSMECIAWTSP